MLNFFVAAVLLLGIMDLVTALAVMLGYTVPARTWGQPVLTSILKTIGGISLLIVAQDVLTGEAFFGIDSLMASTAFILSQLGVRVFFAAYIAYDLARRLTHRP